MKKQYVVTAVFSGFLCNMAFAQTERPTVFAPQSERPLITEVSVHTPPILRYGKAMDVIMSARSIVGSGSVHVFYKL